MRKKQTVMRSVGRARRVWNNHVKQIAQAEGIPDSYRQVIMFLHHHPGSGQRSIAEFVGVTTSAINQVVKSMLEEDYLRKEADPTDRRGTRLYLTEKGESVASRLREKLDDADSAITAFLGEVREAELIEVLENLADFVRREL